MKPPTKSANGGRSSVMYTNETEIWKLLKRPGVARNSVYRNLYYFCLIHEDAHIRCEVKAASSTKHPPASVAFHVVWTCKSYFSEAISRGSILG